MTPVYSGLLLCALTTALVSAADPRQTDLVIYECTSGAITAAVQAKRMSKSVVMICPERQFLRTTGTHLRFVCVRFLRQGGLSAEYQSVYNPGTDVQLGNMGNVLLSVI